MERSLPLLEVVAAAIRKDGHYLLGRRPGAGGAWEFPGGKVDAGEDHETALRRELREELGIEAKVGERIASVEHRYPDRCVHLHLYACGEISGEPRPSFHSELRWFRPEELAGAGLSAADRQLLRFL